MSHKTRRVVAIVGGGFSGAACAIHLSRGSPEPLDIRIIEPRMSLGQGVAHSSSDPDLRLNGPDTIHAPYPDAPGDFAVWMERTGEHQKDPSGKAASGLVFARRGAFGRYMSHEIERHALSNPSGSTIEHMRTQAVSARPAGSGVDIELASGRALRAGHAVLALGWNDVGTPRELAPIGSDRSWFGNPWATDRFDSIDRHAPVLLVGSGLTASDTFAGLVARGHQGPVIALSRRGLRPASQNPFRSTRSIWERVLETEPDLIRDFGRCPNLRETMALLRRRMDAVLTGQSSWHVPFDEFRDAAWILWDQWTPREQLQYLRHVKGWYDAFRFRNPPQTEAIARAGEERGQLSFTAGRLRSARRNGDRLDIEFESRHTGAREVIRSNTVINCTGPQPRPSVSGNPFWQSVLRDGVARDAACGVGIDVDRAGRLIDASGRIQPRLFAIGPPTIGRFAEAIAVPYIVRGILEVVRHISQPTA